MSQMRNWHILVVEDEPDGQEVVRGILDYLHITSDVAGTAEEALQLLDERTYTATIIDLALPEMDGMELVQLIRQNPAVSQIPCMAVTAFHTSRVRKDAFHFGFDAYLPKPIDDTAFVRELDRMIGQGS